MIRAVIFDLDGTLIDHRGAVLAALRSKMARGRPLIDSVVESWFALERRHMDDFLASACSFEEQRRRRLRAWLPLAGDVVPADNAGLDAWFVGYIAVYEAAWAPFDDVAACLGVLAARRPTLRLGVLTNGDSTQQRAKLARLNLSDVFDEILVSDAIGVAKPDSRAFEIACERLGVSPAETVFVGDMLAIDAVPAVASGLIGVWLDRSRDGEAPAGVRVIRSLAELPSLVEEAAQRKER